MDSPSINQSHYDRLKLAYPYAWYVWNRNVERFELWCDGVDGGFPYKAMVLKGEEDQYREPGDWVIEWMRRTDRDNGADEHRHHNASTRREWVSSMTNDAYREKLQDERAEERMYKLKDEARRFNHHGRCYEPAHKEGVNI